MLLADIFVLVITFFAVLFGAGLIVKSVDHFSHKLKLSAFSVSFFVLGILTSIPEFAVGLSAISDGTPEIFVGNLIGGVAIIFFIIIPALSIFGNGLSLNSQLDHKHLLYALLTILAPLFVIADNRITDIEGVVLIGAYGLLFFMIERNRGFLDSRNTEIMKPRSYSLVDILKILLGVAIVFVSSRIIVDKTIILANELNVSTFYISLIALALGTNLPELSLAVKSIVSRKKGIAFGDYIGSAAANTFLFGLFTLLYKGEVLMSGDFMRTFLLVAFGISIFYYFTFSKGNISRKEGIVLILFYVIFAFVERL